MAAQKINCYSHWSGTQHEWVWRWIHVELHENFQMSDYLDSIPGGRFHAHMSTPIGMQPDWMHIIYITEVLKN